MLVEYQKAPQVTRDRMYTDAMQQIYANTTKVLVDSKQGSNLLYLPLDKLMQATGPNGPGVSNDASLPGVAGATTSPATTSPSSAIPTSPNTNDMRVRSDGRTRDRDGR